MTDSGQTYIFFIVFIVYVCAFQNTNYDEQKLEDFFDNLSSKKTNESNLVGYNTLRVCYVFLHHLFHAFYSLGLGCLARLEHPPAGARNRRRKKHNTHKNMLL